MRELRPSDVAFAEHISDDLARPNVLVTDDALGRAYVVYRELASLVRQLDGFELAWRELCRRRDALYGVVQLRGVG